MFELNPTEANIIPSPEARVRYIFNVVRVEGIMPDKIIGSSRGGSLASYLIYHDRIILFYVNIYALIKS